MKKSSLIISILIILISGFSASGKDYVSLVDTRMGTDSEWELSQGGTYPGTGRPFGMHLWTPQTSSHKGLWKYQWNRRTIRGFASTHVCSPWGGDYFSLTFFPQMGDNPITASLERGASFSHSNEIAQPDYYSVTFKNGIKTEMVPTERCCILRFIFPDNGEKAILQIDCWDRRDEYAAVGQSSLEWKAQHPIFSCDYLMDFSIPFSEMTEWNNEKERGVYLTFPAGSTVEVRIGTSYISKEQAELNREREIGRRSLEKVRKESHRIWNETLGKIDVSGGSEDDLKTFYTCLYRSSLNSRIFYELDPEGKPIWHSIYDNKTHEGYMYSDNGFWDAFRSLFPLHNIIYREQQSRNLVSIMDLYDQLGWLPSWYMPNERGGMPGNHSISIFADAWAKGIRPVDPKRIFDAYVHEVTAPREKWMQIGNGRFPQWWTLHYIPYPEVRYSTSTTLEYSYDDWCGLMFAKETGNSEWIRKLTESSGYWRNVFDPETGFMRGKDKDGNWLPDFRPGAWGGPFVEGNSWQHSFGVINDIPSMIEAYGGKDKLCDSLDSLFHAPALIDFGYYGEVWNEMVEMVVAKTGQLNMGNQPCHHIPYLYVYGGQPEKTQFWVRDIMDRLFNCIPKGYPGDEDQGSMSAWFVMSALGFYNVCPGSTEYVIGSPLFRKATINLENGKKFTVIAKNNSKDNIYIQSITLDGKPLDSYFFDHKNIMDGATLEMVMGDTPI